MRICVLGSGSGGNCTLVETGNFRLLIDAARLSKKYIKDRLAEAGVSISEIGAILVTHTHGDHVDDKTTYPLCRKYDIPLFVHSGSLNDLFRRSGRFTDLERAGLVRVFNDHAFPLRDNLWVRPFHVRHGGGGWNVDLVGRPVGFRISCLDGTSEKTFVYATDLGTPEPHIEDVMADSDAIVIESNHDPDMERNSGRPGFLVKWVLGPTGHLSNRQAAGLISGAIGKSGGRIKHILLAHLSRDCNTPELALDCAREAIEQSGASDVHLHLASQKAPSELIEL